MLPLDAALAVGQDRGAAFAGAEHHQPVEIERRIDAEADPAFLARLGAAVLGLSHKRHWASAGDAAAALIAAASRALAPRAILFAIAPCYWAEPKTGLIAA